MDFSIFREYDIRGIVGTHFNPEETYDLGRALVTYFLEKNPKTTTITIGMDGRISSPAIKSFLSKAFTDNGFDVLDLGLCTTPAFYFSLHTQDSKTGIMITASHNPKDHNGIKVCLNTESVSGEELKKIGKYLRLRQFYAPTTNKKGTVHTLDIITHYVAYLADAFSHLKQMDFAAVFDCGNAAGGAVMPALIKAMEWQNVIVLHETIDGTFPNHEADPTELENMQDVKKLLTEKRYLEVGIGLDGDADRMSPMTPSGKLIPGDQILALFSSFVLKEHPKSTIVCDIKCSSTLEQIVTENSGKLLMVPSGHTTIKETMKREPTALLAGELSCHFFFKDRYFGFDDGIYAALRLIEILEMSTTSFDDLINRLPQKIATPEIRFACKEEQKKEIIKHVTAVFAACSDAKLITIDGVRAHLPYGWGLLRASNTQALVSLRFEADTQENLQLVKQDFYTALKAYFTEQELKEKLGLI